MEIDKLLNILACPICKGNLEFIENNCNKGFYCAQCKKVYPVKDEIPVMLVDEAINYEQWPYKGNGPCDS